MGKTTFVNTLFTSTIKEPKNLNKRRTKAPSKTVQIQITRAGKDKDHCEIGEAYLILIYRIGGENVQGQTDHY